MRAARVATGLLGWSAEAFWRATPAELATALEGRLGEGEALAGMTRAGLRAMIEGERDGG